MKIVIASNNQKKLAELKNILSNSLDTEFSLLTLNDVGFFEEIEENGTTFEENAMIKAQTVARLGYITIADDSGLCVDSLGGAPGVYSARYAGEPRSDKRNNEKLLADIKNAGGSFPSPARFVSVIACVNPTNGKTLIARGECEGAIIDTPRGENGFGYDPLFLYPPLNKTFAELDSAEKNEISHRARSLADFMAKFPNIL